MAGGSDQRKLLKACEELGCTIEHAKSGYIKIWLPGGRKFVGLSNYGVVLRDSLWWQDVVTTVIITVVTVAFELVIGFVFAMVMNKIIFGRRTVRTAILLPYGIITVVAAPQKSSLICW